MELTYRPLIEKFVEPVSALTGCAAPPLVRETMITLSCEYRAKCPRLIAAGATAANLAATWSSGRVPSVLW